MKLFLCLSFAIERSFSKEGQIEPTGSVFPKKYEIEELYFSI